MDTTAAAELGAAAALGGAIYWTMDHRRQDYDDEPDGNDGPPPWTPPDHRQRFSGGGEPPLKRSKQNQPYDPFEPSSNGNQALAPSNSRSASAEYGQGASSGTPPPPEPAASASSSGGGGSGSGSGAAKLNRVAIGRMFFKTKLCCKFRTGTCPYVTNCNFAHGMEELRKPPPNWQEIVAQQEEDRALRLERERDRDRDRRISGHVSAAIGGSAAVVVAGGNGNSEANSQRFHKTRFCKKYYTDEGCPYGDRCNFLHDDQGRSRESVAINLGPSNGNGGGENELHVIGSGNNNSNNTGNNSNNGPSQRPMYWKTRICNKWETTGHCPFGEKCHFAHGVAELQKYGGGLLDAENGAASGGLRNDLKQSASSLKPHTDPIGATYSVFGTDNYSMGVLNQRSISNFQGQRQGQRALARWKGPDKISQIYGDWIEDNEWEYASPLPAPQHEEVNQIHEEETHDALTKKVEKWQNGSQTQTNIQFGSGGWEPQNNQNNLSRGGSKVDDMISSGGNLDQVYQDDTLVGEL